MQFCLSKLNECVKTVNFLNIIYAHHLLDHSDNIQSSLIYLCFCLSLYTLDGQKISEPSQLNDSGQYVAVGRERLYV